MKLNRRSGLVKSKNQNLKPLTIKDRFLPKIPAKAGVSFRQLLSTAFGRFFEIPIIELGRFLGKIWKPLEHYIMKLLIPKWGLKVVPIGESIDQTVTVAPNEEIRKIIERVPIYAVGDCFCRTILAKRKCNKPVDVCMIVGWGQELENLIDNGEYRRVSLEQILDKLEQIDKHALVSQLVFFPNDQTFYNICNCCGCCCVGIQALKKFSTPIIVGSPFYAKIDPEKCIGCLKCKNERCNFDAIKKVRLNGEIKAEVVTERCYGCGLCASKKYGCPEGAITLFRRKS